MPAPDAATTETDEGPAPSEFTAERGWWAVTQQRWDKGSLGYRGRKYAEETSTTQPGPFKDSEEVTRDLHL